MLKRRRRIHSPLLRLLAALAALCVLPLAPLSTGAEAAEANDLTAQCAFSLPEAKAHLSSRLTDGRYDSRVVLIKEEILALTVPETARGLYVAWYEVPAACTLTAFDASGAALKEYVPEETLLNAYYALPAGCAELRFACRVPYAVSEIRVYASDTPPAGLAVLDAPKIGAEVMLVLAHTGDEAFYFGSLLPYCVSDDVTVFFLMSESRQSQQEAIELQYALGARTQPLFAAFPYYRCYMDSTKMYQIHKKAELEAYMIALVRKYKPAVLITHDAAGENGDCMHTLAAAHAVLAAQKASNPLSERACAAEYGVWQVQTVYEHRSDGKTPLFDTELPLVSQGGRSARELAEAGYARYAFLAQYRQTPHDAPYFAEVWAAGQAEPAPDAAQTAPVPAGTGQDALFALLEGLSPQIMPSVAAAEAAAAATPTLPPQTPSPTPSASPAEIPAETPAPARAEMGQGGGGTALLWLGIAFCAAGFVLFALLFLLDRRKRLTGATQKRLFAAGLALLLAGGAMCTARFAAPREQTPVAETPPRTASASPAPAAPTAAETPAPTPSPSPTPHPFAAHFRQAGEEAETVLFDAENGVFAYRTDTLGIEIERHSRETPPVVWYVAHIYMRDVDAYRSGFGSQRQNGRDSVDAVEMARTYRAVLAITGDNLVHADFNKKGLAIRDGRLYCAETIESVMILTDDLSMRIYESEDKSMLEEITDGVKTTYTFGPPLLLDGVPYAKMDYHRVSPQNPRVGLGLVEPGHFVAIVAEGRLPGVSHGMLLPDFAQLFLDEGCTLAYNLDGGASASMVFMGEYLTVRASNHYRRVPDQLMWGYSERVPSVNETPVYSGLVERDG